MKLTPMPLVKTKSGFGLKTETFERPGTPGWGIYYLGNRARNFEGIEDAECNCDALGISFSFGATFSDGRFYCAPFRGNTTQVSAGWKLLLYGELEIF